MFFREKLMQLLPHCVALGLSNAMTNFDFDNQTPE